MPYEKYETVTNPTTEQHVQMNPAVVQKVRYIVKTVTAVQAANAKYWAFHGLSHLAFEENRRSSGLEE